MLSLFLLQILQPATAQPIPPVFPDYFDTIQISSCLKESVFCPPGFANQSIASHSYYAYPLSVGLGIDANDISTEASPLFALIVSFHRLKRWPLRNSVLPILTWM